MRLHRPAHGPLAYTVALRLNGNGHVFGTQAGHHAAGAAAQFRPLALRHKTGQQAEHQQGGGKAERYEQYCVTLFHEHPRGRRHGLEPAAV